MSRAPGNKLASCKCVERADHCSIPHRLLITVGSFDHLVVLTKIKLAVVRDEGVSRTNWLWNKGDWNAMRTALANSVENGVNPHAPSIKKEKR